MTHVVRHEGVPRPLDAIERATVAESEEFSAATRS